MAISASAEITAAAIVVQFWNVPVNVAVWDTVFGFLHYRLVCLLTLKAKLNFHPQRSIDLQLCLPAFISSRCFECLRPFLSSRGQLLLSLQKRIDSWESKWTGIIETGIHL